MIGLTVRALMAGCLVPTIAAGVTKAGPNLLRDQAASITCRPGPDARRGKRPRRRTCALPLATPYQRSVRRDAEDRRQPLRPRTAGER